MPIASVNPRRNTAPSSASRNRVIATWWPVRNERQVRVLDQVRGRVGGRQRHRDDEVGRREAEQGQHEQLALPERQQPLEHRDRALAVRALLGHPAVDRERAEQGQGDQHEGRDRGEQAGGERGDAGLVAERGEVVDTGQAHHLPPAMRLLRPFRPGVGAELIGRLLGIGQQPGAEPVRTTARRRGLGSGRRTGRRRRHLPTPFTDRSSTIQPGRGVSGRASARILTRS